MGLFRKKNREPEEIRLDEIDRESKYKIFSPAGDKVLTAVLTCFTLFQLYASISNKVPLQILRYTHLGFAICLAYLIYPAFRHSDRHKEPWYDVLLAFLFFCVVFYFIYNYKALQFRAGAYTQMDTIMAGLGIALVLGACWRVVGPPIVIIASCFFIYGLTGKYMGGFLLHRGFSLKRIITHLFITTEGVIGNPLGVCSTYIFLFILFGAFLEKTGIGQFFIDLANSLAGWAAGGPAKVAVLSSALQGTVSGSSVSNTVSTGSFTIPLMKSLGYEPEFAGAVEAAASTGGQIMPPVMGSAAFLISESCGVPYRQLMLIAIIPASLYFTGIWISVHLEAKRLGLKGTPREQLPKLGPLFLSKGHLILPLVAIIYLMISGFTITRSALIGCVVCIIVPYLRKSTWVSPKQIVTALPQAGKSVVSVATACSTAGIIIGMVTLTGLGQRIGTGIFDLVGNNVFLALVCAMFTSLILGMGVSTTSNYPDAGGAYVLLLLRHRGGHHPAGGPRCLRGKCHREGQRIQDRRQCHEAGHRRLPDPVHVRHESEDDHDRRHIHRGTAHADHRGHRSHRHRRGIYRIPERTGESGDARHLPGGRPAARHPGNRHGYRGHRDDRPGGPDEPSAAQGKK